MKTFNKVQQMTDEEILHCDVDEFAALTKDDSNELSPDNRASIEPEKQGEDSEDEDEDEDFECDIERYVPFEDKLEFAELLKTCSRECLTEVIKLVQELQPQAIDDYGNSRVQLKIDLIERDAYLRCIEIHAKHEGIKRQKTT